MQQLADQPVTKSWWGRNWVWVVPVGCLAPIVICGGCFVSIFGLAFGIMKSSDVYKDSLAAAQAHPALQAEIGTPIRPGLLMSGNIETSGTTGAASISYSVSGPKGKATIYVDATKAAGQWTFDTFVAEIEGTGQRIDLRQSAQAQPARAPI